MMRSSEKIFLNEKGSDKPHHLTSLSHEDVLSIIKESVKINPNLIDAQRAHTDVYKSFTIYNNDHVGRYQVREILKRNPNEKLIIVGEKLDEEINEENKYGYVFELHALNRYPNFRYISYENLLDKEYMKNLYTKQEKRNINIEDKEMFGYKRLDTIITPFLMILSKYPEFSFDYKYKGGDSDLDKSLQYIVKEVSWYCPGFFRSYNQVDDILRFFKNYAPNLLPPNEMKYIINKLSIPIENAKKDEFRDSAELTWLKNITKDLPITREQDSFEYMYQERPPIKEQINKTEELMKVYNEMKSTFPGLFYSIEDLLSFYENIKIKLAYYVQLDQYYKYLKQEGKNVEYRKQILGPVLPGVYCDIDGTLVKTKMGGEQDYEVNEKVVERLLDYYKEGKKITLWSSGSLAKKQRWLGTPNLIKQFEEIGLTKSIMKDMGIADIVGDKVYFRVKNKYLYRYIVPEIVIDDRNQNRFMFHMSIYPQTFINVKDL